MKKLLKLILLVAVVAAIGFWAIQRGGSGEVADEGIGVTVAQVSTRDITPVTLSSGTIIYGDERRLRSDISAQAERVLVEEGDIVDEDQLLIELDTENYETEYEGAEAAVALRRLAVEKARLSIAQLEDRLSRQRELAERNVVGLETVEALERELAFSRLDLQTAEQSLRQSETQLDAIQDKLDRAAIRAPIAGIVSALDIKEGEMTVGSAGAPIISIADPSDVQAEVQVNESKIGNVEVGQTVDVFAVAYPDTAMTGVVEHIATTARSVPGRNTLSFTVRIRIEDDAGLTIKPGMSCRAEIQAATRAEVVSVPSIAVQIEAGQPFVWLYEEGKVNRQDVTLGEPDMNYQEVLTGLTPGQQVVSGPVSKLLLLSDGEPVSVIEE